MFIQLRRPSDGVSSEPLPFQMLPLGSGRPPFWSLRKTLTRKKADYNTFSKILATETALLTNNNVQKCPRNIDEYNNNNNLDFKKSNDKISTLRALNDLYNVKNIFDLQNGDTALNNNNNNNNVNNQVSTSVEHNLSQTKNPMYDHEEVDKWVQKSQLESINDIDLKYELEDELIDQVAELEQIYTDTHEKLIQAALEQTDQSMEIDVCDNQTYTSLQMAMKNPIDLFDINDDKRYEDVYVSNQELHMPLSSPLPIKRDVNQDFGERLPPLPPKRIRKTPSMPVLTRPESKQDITLESSLVAPNKNLPSLPRINAKQNRQSLFSKLFMRKHKKDKPLITDTNKTNNRASMTEGSISSLLKDSLQDVSQLQAPRPSVASVTSMKSFKLDGDETPLYGVDLTEAEHYALYTAMAPHATASEFDELSFYYSPVEGGKILTEAKPI